MAREFLARWARIWLVRAYYLLLQVALGGLVYALLIGLLRVVKREEVDPLLHLRKPKSTDAASAVVARPQLRPQPLVSVFILVYNGEQYVAQAIESVLNQSYQNYELIIIDDGSTDQTALILSRYQDRPHLTLYTNR